MNNTIIRTFFGLRYKLVDQLKYRRGGQMYKNTFWRRVDTELTGDHRDTMTIECRIPSGYADIDMRYLSESCIKPGFVIDEPVFVKNDEDE